MSKRIFCCQQVVDHTGYRLRGCSKTGKFEHDEGRFYCAVHYPPNVVKRGEISSAKWKEKWDAEIRNMRKIELFDVLLQLLIESQTDIGGDWRSRRDAAVEKGRAA